MRRRFSLLLAVGMLTACGAPSSTAPPAQPSDVAPGTARTATSDGHHLDVVAPPRVTAEDVPARPAGPPGEDAAFLTATSPETTATEAVLQHLEEEALLALDLAATLTFEGEGAAVVQVRVLFGTGRSHPHQETYLVRLIDDAGAWTVADIEVAP